MPLKNHPLIALQDYLPHNTFDDVIYFMESYKIHLTLRKDRKSILGDYRPAIHGKPHRISLNISLNPYHFLITFVHELAHLITFLNYQNKVSPHGKEWKQCFALLLKRFTEKNVFPEDIERALHTSLRSAKASTCSDPGLFKVLQRYDEKSGGVFVERIGVGNHFITEEGKVFSILNKRRTRYECIEVKTGHKYLFPALYEVKIYNELSK